MVRGGSRETVEVESVRKKIERMRRCRREGGVVVVGSEIGGGGG